VTGPSPTLVFIVGPGAVGKMTVGTEFAARTGLTLFHNSSSSLFDEDGSMWRVPPDAMKREPRAIERLD